MSVRWSGKRLSSGVVQAVAVFCLEALVVSPSWGEKLKLDKYFFPLKSQARFITSQTLQTAFWFPASSHAHQHRAPSPSPLFYMLHLVLCCGGSL